MSLKIIKIFLKCGFFLTILLVGQISYAEEENINLTIKNNGNIIFSDNFALPQVGVVDINDTGGSPHSVDAKSVLNMVNIADIASLNFNISNLIYYSSFGAFYLKCITISSNELCDNWQYKVNGTEPMVGMDQNILSGGESIVLFFGDENPAPEPAVIQQSGGGPLVSFPIIEEKPLEFSLTNQNQEKPLESIASVPLTITSSAEKLTLVEVKEIDPLVINKIEEKQEEKKLEVKPKTISKKNPENILPQIQTTDNTNIIPTLQVLLASAGENENNIPLPIIIGGITILGSLIILRFLKFII